MMVGAHDFAIHLVGSQHMDVVAVGGSPRFFLRRSAPRPQDKCTGNQQRGKESILVTHSFVHSFASRSIVPRFMGNFREGKTGRAGTVRSLLLLVKANITV